MPLEFALPLVDSIAYPSYTIIWYVMFFLYIAVSNTLSEKIMAEPDNGPTSDALLQSLLTDFGFVTSGPVIRDVSHPVQDGTSLPVQAIGPPPVQASNSPPVQVIISPPVPVIASLNWDSTDEDESDIDSSSDISVDAILENPVHILTTSAIVLLDSPDITTQGPFWKERRRLRQMLGSPSLDGAFDDVIIRAILSGDKYRWVYYPEKLCLSADVVQRVQFPQEILDQFVAYACTGCLDPGASYESRHSYILTAKRLAVTAHCFHNPSQLVLFHWIMITYAWPVSLWLDILAMNPAFSMAIRRVDVRDVDEELASLPSLLPIISCGYLLQELSISKIPLTATYAQHLSMAVPCFDHFCMQDCSYKDDAILSLLERASSLESISLGIPQPCVLLNKIPTSSTPPDESLIVYFPPLLSPTPSTMHMFTYVAEYGTNYLLKFPRFKDIILYRTCRLTTLYLCVDYRSLETVQELVDGTLLTLESLDVLLNNWPRSPTKNVDLSLCSSLESLSLGQDCSSLMVLCKSLSSCPRTASVKTMNIAVQTSPFASHDAPWWHFVDLFHFDRRFPIAEWLYVDLYTCAARDLAHQDVKDLVILICSSFASAPVCLPGLDVQVHRKLGMQRFDWYMLLQSTFVLMV
ncbi:hypothetical protein EDD85DRAFT_956727 [Armillaria nabsnona]|nr:hypothetical protein EDD85DRAFT_956727 [Armillaria nabsnona]